MLETEAAVAQQTRITTLLEMGAALHFKEVNSNRVAFQSSQNKNNVNVNVIHITLRREGQLEFQAKVITDHASKKIRRGVHTWVYIVMQGGCRTHPGQHPRGIGLTQLVAHLGCSKVRQQSAVEVPPLEENSGPPYHLSPWPLLCSSAPRHWSATKSLRALAAHSAGASSAPYHIADAGR